MSREECLDQMIADCAEGKLADEAFDSKVSYLDVRRKRRSYNV